MAPGGAAAGPVVATGTIPDAAAAAAAAAAASLPAGTAPGGSAQFIHNGCGPQGGAAWTRRPVEYGGVGTTKPE